MKTDGGHLTPEQRNVVIHAIASMKACLTVLYFLTFITPVQLSGPDQIMHSVVYIIVSLQLFMLFFLMFVYKHLRLNMFFP